MNKCVVLISLILIILNSQLIIGQNQEVNIEEEENRELVKLRDRVFQAIKDGQKPNPTEEEKKRWKNNRRAECGASWIANLPDFYATEEEVVSIVVVSGYFVGLPSIDSSEVEIDLDNKIFRLRNHLDIFTACDGCISEKTTDTLYVGKLPIGDYTVFYERNCGMKKEAEMYRDTLSFKIHPSGSQEELAKMKKQKILEQIPENLPPIIDGASRKEEILFQYTLTKAEKISVEIHHLSGTKKYTLMKPTLQTNLGYNELYLSIPDNLKAPNGLTTEEYYKILLKIGDKEYESLDIYYW